MPIVPPTVEPNHELNFPVLEVDNDEAMVACYMQLEAKIVNRGEIFVADN